VRDIRHRQDLAADVTEYLLEVVPVATAGTDVFIGLRRSQPVESLARSEMCRASS
jgi:hypothetical protein